MERLAPTQEERSLLLKSYFEPSDEDRKNGIKVPSEAHRAIAALTKAGYIRIIVTTNFDQLLEMAMREEGLNPIVVDSAYALGGALPYVHAQCTIVKLNGDYPDIRMLNTENELERYEDQIKGLLEEIFDRYGLIVCGWSADWDTDLRDSLLAKKNRRFSTFWAVRGEKGSNCARLVEHLKARVIEVQDANQFFTDLLCNVKSIEALKSKHPSTVQVAIATTKTYLSEDKYRINLHDFVTDVVEEAFEAITSERFKQVIDPSSDDQFKRMREYEELMKVPIGVLGTLIYHGDGQHEELIVSSMNRFLQRAYPINLKNLDLYPVQLMLYASGMIALERKKYHLFHTLLTKTEIRNEGGRKVRYVDLVNVRRVFQKPESLWKLPELKDNRTPVSNYLGAVLKNNLKLLIRDEKRIDDMFDIFEYISSLVYMDLDNPVSSEQMHIGSLGRFYPKYYGFGMDANDNPVSDFMSLNGQLLTEAGFFNQDNDRLKQCNSGLREYMGRHSTELLWQGKIVQ